MARINEKHGGARKGAGRKPKADEQDVLDLMGKAWPLARRVKAVQRMASEAEAGNVKAATLLMNYAYGKPNEHKTVELVGMDAAKAAMLEFLSRHPKAKPEVVAPIYAEQFDVDAAELISEANN